MHPFFICYTTVRAARHVKSLLAPVFAAGVDATQLNRLSHKRVVGSAAGLLGKSELAAPAFLAGASFLLGGSTYYTPGSDEHEPLFTGGPGVRGICAYRGGSFPIAHDFAVCVRSPLSLS